MATVKQVVRKHTAPSHKLDPNKPGTLVPGTIVEVNPSLLKFDEVNRPTDPKHVNKLKQAISRENLIHLDPFKVTPSLDIIDGQHRARAAMELGLPTVHVMVVSANIHAAPKLNAVQKKWSSQDWAHYWNKLGRKDYGDFLEFCQLTGIVPSVSIEILGVTGGRMRESFKEGLFKIRSLPEAYTFVEHLEAFKPYIERNYRKPVFVRAFLQVYKHPAGYDHQRMLAKLTHVGLKPANTTERFLEQLEAVYNWKMSHENRVKFTE